MFIINRPRYHGRFFPQIKDLIQIQKKRVGEVVLGPDDDKWYCHVCNTHHQKPELDPVHKDLFGECPSCKTPFLFVAFDWKPGT